MKIGENHDLWRNFINFYNGKNIISDNTFFYDTKIELYNEQDIEIKKINIDRYYQYGINVLDKLTDNIIMCYNYEEAENCTKIMNTLNRETEKLKAEIRARKL